MYRRLPIKLLTLLQSAAAAGGSDVTITIDTYANLPGSPAEGDIWIASNTALWGRYSGSAWAYYYRGFPVTLPATGDFSWDNQGSSTVDATDGGILLSTPNAVGENLRVRYQAVTGNYTAIFGLQCPGLGANVAAFGTCWRQSSDGKIIANYFIFNTNISFLCADWNSSTSSNAANTLTPAASQLVQLWHATQFLWFKLQDNGTNRVLSVSTNKLDWWQLYSESRTTFLTADQVGWFVQSNSGGTVSARLWDYEES